MRLTELVDGGLMDASGVAAKDVEITGLTSDSRNVAPGFLFAALPGTRAHGRDFVSEALERGAVAVLAPAGMDLPGIAAEVPVVRDSDPRRRFALMAARLYPAQPRLIAAVTGTNGKTSVAAFTRQMWERLGHRPASLGTLGLAAPGVRREGVLTTPDPVELHRLLDELAGSGVDHCVIEASSHGLDQRRLDGVRVTIAGFTNLSRDHLDYHADMDAYLAAKLRLFDTVMAPGGTAVLNADAPEFEPLSQICVTRGHEIVSYGARAADLVVHEAAPTPSGQDLRLTAFGREAALLLPLVGAFQVRNALCALGLVIAGGAEVDAALETVEYLEGARGRMERVAYHPAGASVYVDYAHTPDALENVLSALRPHAQARLVVVFGCGGDRDPGKRPLMGEIAGRLADVVFVTDDNPRSESPAAIRRQILDAAETGRAEVREAGGRREAIEAAVAMLEAGDVLVIAGKGHERGQIVGDAVHPFDDAEVARAAVAQASGGRR